MLIQDRERTSRLQLSKAAPSSRLFLDVSDMVFYMGHHDHFTGIQRVQASLILAMHKGLTDEQDLVYVSWNRVENIFSVLDTASFISIVQSFSLPTDRRTILFDHVNARMGILPGAAPLEPTKFKGIPCTLLLIGAAWVNVDYFYKISLMKRLLSARFACVIHDLIPIFARETCDQGTAEVFTGFLEQAYRLTDLFICVSESTCRDLLRFFRESGRPEPLACVIPHAAELSVFDQTVSPDGEDQEVEHVADEAPAGAKDNTAGYVLFVSTIEGRKNHFYALRIWKELYVRLGPDTPTLLCVGRYGWRAESFIRDLVGTEFLSGHVKVLKNVSDSELHNLYQKCLFTIYPSLYEGWGLPISESLSNGKVCVCSNTSSMPEAGGEHAIYIDPLDVSDGLEKISTLIDSPALLRERSEKIVQEFVPRSWADAATDYRHQLALSAELPAPRPFTDLQLGKEYTLRSLPLNHGDKLGDQLFEAIRGAYTSPVAAQGMSVMDIFAGQELRGAGDWKVPESWGTWIGVDGAEIEFNYRGRHKSRVICLAAYRVLGLFITDH